MRSEKIDFLSEQGQHVSLSQNHRLSINSASAMQKFVIEDFGLAILPENFTNQRIASG